jgi:hypothetical protein
MIVNINSRIAPPNLNCPYTRFDYISHYTSAESLALILKSKKLRFTRIDRLDDTLEAENLTGIQFGKYVFVSCWTEETEENLPQWHMYSGGMTGVRIQLPRNPFQSLIYMPPSDFPGIEIDRPMEESPLTFEESIGSNYCVAPLFFDNHFAAPVQYVKDVKRCYENHVTIEDEHTSDSKITIYDAGRLIRYKSEIWSFQQEYRFALTILPTHLSESTVDFPKTEMLGLQHVTAAYEAGVDHGLQFFDLPISEKAIDSLVVRTGPLCASNTIAYIEAILSQWAPKARLEPSTLTGTIRAR